MKKIFVLILGLFLISCASSSKNDNDLSNSISLDKANLKFVQTSLVGDENFSGNLINIHENVNECTLEICEYAKNNGIGGDSILIGTNMETPSLIGQMFKNDYAVENYSENIL